MRANWIFPIIGLFDNAATARQSHSMSQEKFLNLATALRERLAIIGDRELYARDPAVHLEKLKSVSEKIALLSAALPKPLDKNLEHYLQRASYEKALSWLSSHGV